MKNWILHTVVFAAGASAAAFAWPSPQSSRDHGLESTYREIGAAEAVAGELETFNKRIGAQCREAYEALLKETGLRQATLARRLLEWAIERIGRRRPE